MNQSSLVCEIFVCVLGVILVLLVLLIRGLYTE